MIKYDIKNVFIFFVKFLLFSTLLFIVWYKIGAELYNYLLTSILNLISIVLGKDVFFGVKGISLIIYGAHPDKKEIIVNGLSLTLNICPLVSLLLATPVNKKKWRTTVIPISILLLLITHIIHIYLDCLVVYPFNGMGLKYKYLYPVRYYFVRVGIVLFSFFEQVGRQLFPFMIWLLFEYKLELSRKS